MASDFTVACTVVTDVSATVVTAAAVTAATTDIAVVDFAAFTAATAPPVVVIIVTTTVALFIATVTTAIFPSARVAGIVSNNAVVDAVRLVVGETAPDESNPGLLLWVVTQLYQGIQRLIRIEEEKFIVVL